MNLKSWSRTDPLTAVKQTTELDGKVNWWIPPLLHGSLETCFHLKKTCGSPRSLTPYFFMSRVRAFPTVGSWQLQPSLPRHVPRGSRGLAVFAEARAWPCQDWKTAVAVPAFRRLVIRVCCIVDDAGHLLDTRTLSFQNKSRPPAPFWKIENVIDIAVHGHAPAESRTCKTVECVAACGDTTMIPNILVGNP